MIPRRRFLRTTTAAGGVLLCRCPLIAAAGSAASVSNQAAAGRRQVVIGGKRVRTVDVHCHTHVPDILPLVRDRKEVAGRALVDAADERMSISARFIDARLREMDREGIDIQAISPQSQQANYWAEPELAAQIVRIQNERLAGVCAAHSDRFVALGGVAMQHPGLAVEQMDYAVKKLGMRGFMIAGSINGEEISHSKFDPFWKKAEALGILIFIHPTGFADGARRLAGAGSLGNTIGNPLETTVALSHMIFEGFLDRFPGLRILAAHGGGYLPSYIGRSDKCSSWNEACQKMRRKPSEYLKGPQLHFDSVVYNAENIRHLVATAGASQVVIGTDFAYDMASRTPVDDVLNTPGLTLEEQTAILGGNAARLLKLER